MKKFYVYALIDPRTSEAFYIGKGSGNRLLSHLSSARRGGMLPSQKRIREIESVGLQVQFTKLFESGDEFEAYEEEKKHIAANGFSRLTNLTAGGNGNLCGRDRIHTYVCTDIHRSRISASLKGRVVTEDTKAKIATSLCGRKRPPEVRAKISASLIGKTKGRPKSEQTRQRMRAAQASKTWAFTPEIRLKMRLAKLGKPRGPMPDECKEKIRSSMVARNTPECRKLQSNRMKEWHKKKGYSPEKGQKIANKLRGRKWPNRKPISPEGRERIRLSQVGRKIKFSADGMARIVEGIRRSHRTPEYRMAQSDRMKKWWAERNPSSLIPHPSSLS